jgi:hypothetical protein
VNKQAVLDRVTELAADLELSKGVQAEEWEHAIAAITAAVVRGQVEPIAQLPTAELTAAMDVHVNERLSRLERTVYTAVGQAPQAQEFLVCRRELPIISTAVPGGLPGWAAGRRPSRTFGPFHDTLGRPVFIDQIPIDQANFRLVRSAGAAPFLTLPISDASPTGDQFSLTSGNVWLDSTQLASDAPAGGYTGLKILGGAVTFTQSIEASGLEILVPDGVDCTITLQLDSGSAPPGSGAGADARAAKVFIPANVTLTFTRSGATLQSIDSGQLEVYGTAVALKFSLDTPGYSEFIQRIVVAAEANVSEFTAATVQSDLFRPSGTAPLLAGAWALPVAVVSPDSLGDASGAGGLGLFLGDGLAATWKGLQGAISLAGTFILVEPGLINIFTIDSRGLGARQTIELWGKAGGGPSTSRIELSWTMPFSVRFGAGSQGEEAAILPATMTGSLDRPITASGNRVRLHAQQAFVAFLDSPTTPDILINASLDPAPSPELDVAFAIDNAMLRVTAAAKLLLTGRDFDGKRAADGSVEIGFGLQFLLPSLPDPYAANFPVPSPPFAEADLPRLAVQIDWSRIAAPVLTLRVSQSPTAARPPAPSPEIPVFPDVTLLDLSTNLDQFGVTVKIPVTGTGTIPPGPPLSFDGLHLVCRGDSISVMTLPAVLWEAVFTETGPPFPSPLTFEQHGGPTKITVPSGRLIRVAPEPALDNVVANFTTAEKPLPASASLTLPFAIVAFAELIKPGLTSARGAAVNYNRPNFSSESVTGGHQITLRAIDPDAAGSPSFPGNTAQLRIGLSGGVPVNKSVLDDKVDKIFNDYFGPFSSTAQVPITRIDLSGYGESLFSDWRNPTDEPVAISQVRFDVLVGRTAYEVIQVRSVLYPYAVRVVRTITISRKNSAGVVRKDSGWQAVTDGEYAFPSHPDTVLVTHPGVVRRIRNVRNLRDTGQIIDAGGVQVAGVRFDGELEIENVVSGPALAPARDQIGYVQLTPVAAGSLTGDQYRTLIDAVGPMGGPIDCTMNVGGSGQLMRVGRVGVAYTQIPPGRIEFVMAAWGMPQFAQGGQWSFLRQVGNGTAPELIDKNRGVPLIRAGAAPGPPGGPYRFADPEDLASPESPASDYGIVHATGTQRVFFPRPRIEPATPDRITSTQPPVLADPYSLATAVGYFPRTDAAIPFPDSNYALVISGGNYRLDMPTSSFPVAIGTRTLADAGSVSTVVDYKGSTVDLTIDTATSIPWSFRLANVAVVAVSARQGELMRIAGDIEADANTNTHVANDSVSFGKAFSKVQSTLPFMNRLPIPVPLPVSMTNELQIKVAVKIPLDKELNKQLPTKGPRFADTDVTIGCALDLPVSEVEFELNAAIFLPTSFPPLRAVGLFNFDLKISTEVGNVVEMKFGGGVGVIIDDDAPFEIVGYIVETFIVVVGDVFSLGAGILLKGTIDFEVIEVDISAEAKLAFLQVECPDTTVFAVAQVTFAIEVTVAFLFEIDIQFQAEWDSNFNGGPCKLPDAL